MPRFINIAEWRLPTAEEHRRFFNRGKTIGNRPDQIHSLAVFRTVLSPLDLYCYLKARFGEPNGFQNLLKTDSSDNLIHWQFELLEDKRWVDISGFTTSVHIRVEGSQALTKHDWLEFAEDIKRDFSSYGTEKSRVLKSLEKWRLFINPYRRIKDATERLAKDVEQLSSKKFPKLNIPSRRSAFERYRSLTRQKMEVNLALREKGLALKFLTPVLAESFVNMLLFLLRKPEVRENQRVYEDAVRKQIDIRVASLPLLCSGFRGKIDVSTEEFKGFKRVMDSRNDFLHGNVDPIRFGFEDIFFDRKTPLLKRGYELFDMTAKNALRFIEPTELLDDLESVRRFCVYLLDQVQPQLRPSIRTALDAAELGWNVADQRAGVLLSPNMAESMLGGLPSVFYDDE